MASHSARTGLFGFVDDIGHDTEDNQFLIFFQNNRGVKRVLG